MGEASGFSAHSNMMCQSSRFLQNLHLAEYSLGKSKFIRTGMGKCASLNLSEFDFLAFGQRCVRSSKRLSRGSEVLGDLRVGKKRYENPFGCMGLVREAWR